MRVDLSLADPVAEPDVLEELGDWLNAEFELRGGVRRQAGRAMAGEMGAVSDALSVALAGGGAISVLAASLRVWFAQPRRSDIRFKIRTSHGEVIEVDAKRVNDAEAILKAAMAREAEAGPTIEGDRGAAARP